MRLYRIVITTGTPQDRDRGEERISEVVYCGYDRLEAIRLYHLSRAMDCGGEDYTGRCRLTVAKSKEIVEA